MRRVAIAVLKDRLSEYIDAVEKGEEIIVTRHGRETARLVPPADDLTAQKAALRDLIEIGRRNRAACGPTTAADIRQWIEEDRP